MARPASLPIWATDATYPMDGADEEGTNTKTEPVLGKKQLGYRPGELPPARTDNWWRNNVYQWAEYLDSGELEGPITIDGELTVTDDATFEGDVFVEMDLNVNGAIVADGSIDAGSDIYADGDVFFGQYRTKTWSFGNAFITTAGSLVNGVDNGPLHASGDQPFWELTANSKLCLPLDGCESGIRMIRVRVIADLDLAYPEVTFEHSSMFTAAIGNQGTMLVATGSTGEGFMYFDFAINFPFDVGEGVLPLLKIETNANAIRFRKVVATYNRPKP